MKKNIYFGGAKNYSDLIFKGLKKENYSIINELNSSVDIIYWIYGGGPKLYKNLYYWLNPRKKIIIHWIGTDVLVWGRKINSNNLRTRIYYKLWKSVIKYKVKTGQCINLAGAEWLKDELNEIGITSIVVPITSINLEIIKYINRTKNDRLYDFISYTPYERFEFYGGHKIVEIAKVMKDRKFLLVMPDLQNLNKLDLKYPPNVKIIPQINFIEMQKYLSNSKCFLRFTEHDGLSLSVLEALMHGLNVIWTYNFDYCKYINFYEMKTTEIIELLYKTVNEQIPKNDAHEFVLTNFSVNKIQNIMTEIFEKIKF